MDETHPFDTGDLVVHKPTQIPHMVACQHGHYLHTAGYPEHQLMVDDCALQRKATEVERRSHIEAMARSSSTNHRAACARERTGVTREDEYVDSWCWGD